VEVKPLCIYLFITIRVEIKEEIEEIKTTSFVDIMKEEMEKSLGNMATEI